MPGTGDVNGVWVLVGVGNPPLTIPGGVLKVSKSVRKPNDRYGIEPVQIIAMIPAVVDRSKGSQFSVNMHMLILSNYIGVVRKVVC